MLDRVRQFVMRYGMFSPGQRVGVAVSGGADSICLLSVLRALAPEWDLNLSVVHVEHGIRGEASTADMLFVRAAAEVLGLPFHIHHANVPGLGGNQEQAAREVRQHFFRQLIDSDSVQRIATGHTRSDQAETVLYRLARGAGTAGLSGIRPVTREGLIRPLLELDRTDIEAWLRAGNITWREDASNQDLGFARNLIRRQILPALREAINPEVTSALASAATLAQDEEAYWSETLDAVLPERQVPLILATSEFTERPRAFARRLMRRAIEIVKGDLRQIDLPHIEALLGLTRAREGHARLQVPGVDAMRSFEWVRFVPLGFDGAHEDRDYSVQVTPPGSARVPQRGVEIALEICAGDPHLCDKIADELNWQRICELSSGRHAEVTLRNWRPGDQYRARGESHPQKVKSRFQESRIPLWERRHWPMITMGDVILWSRLFGVAAEFAADASTKYRLRVRELEAGQPLASETAR